jgi:hypothetical protein
MVIDSVRWPLGQIDPRRLRPRPLPCAATWDGELDDHRGRFRREETVPTWYHQHSELHQTPFKHSQSLTGLSRTDVTRFQWLPQRPPRLLVPWSFL